MTGIFVELTDVGGHVRATLDALVKATGTTGPLMADVAAAMLSASERQFQTQSGPLGSWPQLSDVTLRLRARRGVAGSPMLQISGAGLAASVQADHSADEAVIGSNKPYARMQFYGGITSPRSMIPNRRIPARPFLPFNPETGEISENLREDILDVLEHHIERNLMR